MNIIRIQAKCDAFEIDEQIDESKVLKRLQSIKNIFLYKKTKRLLGRKIYIGSDKLSVTTTIINPKLF